MSMTNPCLLLMLAALTSCAATEPKPDAIPPARHFNDAAKAAEADRQFAVYDPIAGTNKEIYKFNAQFDEYVFLPIINGYQAVTPQFLRDRVSNFFANIGEFGNFTNSVLQVRGQKAITTLGRFVVNTTVGLLGTFDVATGWGMERQAEDFGQTLGVWGLSDGPYLVIPVLGPSNLRDTAGNIVDLLTFSFIVPNGIENSTAYEIAYYGVRPIDARYRNGFRYFHSGSPFEYEFIRYIRKNQRDAEIQK